MAIKIDAIRVVFTGVTRVNVKENESHLLGDICANATAHDSAENYLMQKLISKSGGHFGKTLLRRDLSVVSFYGYV